MPARDSRSGVEPASVPGDCLERQSGVRSTVTGMPTGMASSIRTVPEWATAPAVDAIDLSMFFGKHNGLNLMANTDNFHNTATTGWSTYALPAHRKDFLDYEDDCCFQGRGTACGNGYYGCTGSGYASRGCESTECCGVGHGYKQVGGLQKSFTDANQPGGNS